MEYAPDIEALLGTSNKEVASIPVQQGGLSGPYDAAGRFDNAMALWSPPLLSADREILPNKFLIDSRVRDALRNDAYVAAGASIHRNSIVGAMFLLNAKPETAVLGLDEVWEAEFQEEVETKFTLWAESADHWPDAARMNTLTGLVRLAIGIYLAGGECLASVEWLRQPGRVFNTAIQMIDLDRLSTPGTMIDGPQADGTNIRGGIRRDRYGAPLSYFIRVAHPSDWTYQMNNFVWREVPVRKPAPWNRLQMIHIMEQGRPDQTRGISQMVSALKETRIAKKFREIVLQNAVLNATYAASIESELPSGQVFSQLGGSDNIEAGLGGAVTNYAADYLNAINAYTGGNSRNFTIDGVKVPHLFPGTKLQLRPAGQGGPLGTEFEASLHRYLAATLDVSYEELSRDYSKTNYSSAKAAAAQTEKAMAAKKRAVADRFASIIYRLWLEEAISKKQITALSKRASANFWEGQNGDAYSSAEWIGASKGQIDELKETQAAVLRINNNLSTWQDESARLGKDYRKQFRQIAREKALQKQLGIEPPPPNPNMMNATTGQPEDKTGANP